MALHADLPTQRPRVPASARAGRPLVIAQPTGTGARTQGSLAAVGEVSTGKGFCGATGKSWPALPAHDGRASPRGQRGGNQAVTRGSDHRHSTEVGTVRAVPMERANTQNAAPHQVLRPALPRSGRRRSPVPRRIRLDADVTLELHNPKAPCSPWPSAPCSMLHACSASRSPGRLRAPASVRDPPSAHSPLGRTVGHLTPSSVPASHSPSGTSYSTSASSASASSVGSVVDAKL